MPAYCFTGHRPVKINAEYPASHRYSENTTKAIRVKAWLKKHITRIIQENDEVTFICGGALGVDTWALDIIQEVRHDLNRLKFVKIHLYLPCVEHYVKWKEVDIDRVKMHINYIADEVKYVYAGRYPGAWCLQKRNEAMVDNADGVIAVWDTFENGGTWNCIEYAMKNDVPILGFNPVKEKQFVIK